MRNIFQLLLLLFLISKDKNDGEKELFREQTWRPSIVVFFILSINIYAYSTYYLTKFPPKWSISNISWLFYFHLFLFLLICVFILKIKKNIRILGFKKCVLKKYWGLILISFLILLLPYILGNLNKITVIAEDIKGMGLFNGSVYIILVTITGPIIEESLFRGIMYSPYRKKYGATIAIILNALLFTASHYGLKGNASTYFMSGFVYCLLYEKTESIIPSIVAHSGINLLAIIAGFYMLK